MSRPVSACPQCGGPVEFAFSTSVQTTCQFCRSILVRSDMDLRKVGEVAELPPNVSPIQLRTQGVYKGRSFTVAGRIIYEWEQGAWNEWHIVFSNSESGWLSDAQAAYAVTFGVSAKDGLPAVGDIFPGKTVILNGEVFEIASITNANYVGVEGELPFEYWDKSRVPFADLRTTVGTFGTIDYSEEPPLLFLGENIDFAALQLRNLKELKGPQVKAQALECPNCGGSVELRSGEQAVSAACVQCLSILDATTPSLKVIQKVRSKERIKPLIPLGNKGKLRGEEYQVIGFQERSILVDAERYAWREYVLFDIQRGFRYLSEYDGHWNYVKPLDRAPEPTTAKGRKAVRFEGETYKHFQGASATTNYVMGEFPWRVRVGEQVFTDDYISPPRMLSSETTNQEITWSVGEYIAAAELWKAFGVQSSPPAPRGIYANQPSPHGTSLRSVGRTFLLLLGLMLASIILSNSLMQDKTIFKQQFSYVTGTKGEASFVTPEFELTGRPSNVEISIRTNLDNSWLYFNLALVNETTGQAWDWGREVSYYHGRDSDGSWSEGDAANSSTLGEIPAGRYYLRVEPEWEPPGGTSALATPARVDYSIEVKRDVPQLWFYILIFFLLLIPPVWKYFRSLGFEGRRWQESQYSSG